MAGGPLQGRVKDGLPVVDIDPNDAGPYRPGGTHPPRSRTMPRLILGLLMFAGGAELFLWGGRSLLADTGTLEWRMPLLQVFAGAILLLSGPRLFIGPSPLNWRCALSSIPDFVTSGVFALTWVSPQLIGKDSVTRMTQVMVLEFIIIHASVMLTMTVAHRGRGRKWMLGFWALVALYILVPLAISVEAREWWPLIAFGALTINKFAGAVIGAPSATGTSNLTRWALASVLYLGLTFATVAIPFPALGAAGYGGNGEGIWQQHPERVLAMGTVYFLLLGFFEFSRGVPGSTLEEVERQMDQANLPPTS